MAGSLFGEIVNTCDSTSGFSAGSISNDDDFAQGTGAPGAKVSNTYTAFYTTALGASAPYSFAAGGNKAGQHFLMWFSSKSKLDAASGYRIIMGNGTSRGEWDVPPKISELKRNGAFVSRVINPARDFDRIAAGSWSTTGNPAQLSNITQMGGGLQTIVSIMGSFNNAQVDQMTIGYGIRLSGGTAGAPDSFETARAADEDAGIWGWSQDKTLKGGVYIGPETGSAAEVFTSINESRTFSASPVAIGFYRIEARGAGTDVTISGANINAENSAIARWDYTVGADTKSWIDAGSVYSGIGVMTLESFATPSGLKIKDIGSIIQNGATINSFDVSSPATANGVALITANNLSLIAGCTFTSSGTGYAVDLGTIAASETVTWNNMDTGYAASDGSTGNETILVNVASGQILTINVAPGASTPTVHNTGAGTANVVAGQITLRVSGLPDGVEARFKRGSTTLLHEQTITGGSIDYVYTFASRIPVTVSAGGAGWVRQELEVFLENFDQTIPLNFEPDPSYT